ncbi:MAG TPA: glycosyltransferase family 2 protein, partial [Saprospiraceae bacterium]|nr:glycosyltransferase family 2 protein [Saprospiraceae bacterium]
MQQYWQDAQTEGLLFHYRHFYGSYDYIGASRRWYRREMRIVRNDKRIFSYQDAQGFRLATGPAGSNRKLRVRLIPAHIHHYGWVKNPAAQQRKQHSFNRLWHDDATVNQRVGLHETYAYDGSLPLTHYSGTHPQVMMPRIEAMNWRFADDPTTAHRTWKDRLSDWTERHFDWRPGEYRNYVLLR